ncbi:hypothetical protein [Cryobacterium sp. MLB-32]|uniref:hypothetical protein n=2 Tax=Cryobacterium sp. MLB-32 TaxID=1529318 RepID=UPI0012DFEE41|nr:hypothetical protein [Cryobacterium sp. MLB-32]
MKDIAKKHVSLRGLHLLWTVPLAFVPGYVAALLLSLDRCGFTQCVGEPRGFASSTAPDAVYMALGAGLLMFAALALTPWLRPIWLRLIAALGLSVLLAAYWVWFHLFSY